MNMTVASSQNLESPSVLQHAGRVMGACQQVTLSLITERSLERRGLELDIARKFERHYGARLNHFLPNLLRLSVADKLGAVVGIRPACREALFLEQYLDSPVEQSIARAFHTPVDRDKVVEIGNLVAGVHGLTYTLFAVLATVLHQAGYRWVACTATPQVRTMLARVNFPSQIICQADPARLAEGPASWGDYYASRPQVIVGDVESAATQVAGNPEMLALMRRFAGPIEELSKGLARATVCHWI
jgi:hypothetical protein